jgi:serine/threonine-protein kinase
MAISAPDVFLSYKAEDRPRLTPLVDALEAEGFAVWWDAHIGVGTNWQKDIEQHLEAAKCVIVAWTKRSVGDDGDFVRDEARRAQRRNVYIPICLDGVEPPLGFGEIQALSLKGWKGDRPNAQFQAVVDAVRRHVLREDIPHRHMHISQPHISRRAAIAGGTGVAALAAAGGGWLLLHPMVTNERRIAVLPFADLSGSQDEAYFAEGIAEELRSALSRIGLEVIGRASSDAVKNLDTKSAASKLGVGNILTGSVRRSPRMLRINAQLVDGTNGVQRWAQSYDRAPGDAIEIQADIAANVVQAMSIALGKAVKVALTLGGTADSAAQDLYLRARKLYFTTDDVRPPIALLDAAIARDPNYADAWHLKARAFEYWATTSPDTDEKLAQAEAAARRAIAISPRLGSAYVILARIEGDRLDFRSALENMRRGFALSPEDLDVLSPAVQFLWLFGEPQKALELADRVIALDPLHSDSYSYRGDVLLWALRDYPQAIAAYRKALELAPEVSNQHIGIGYCLTLMNRVAEARAEYAKASPDDMFRLTGEAILAARARDRTGAEGILEHIRAMFGAAASFRCAEVYAQAGEADRAFAELDNAVRAKDSALQQLKRDPFLDGINRDPRFAALLERLNFP